MTTEAASAIPAREPALLGQTVVVLGGSAGIGLETARRARGEGADVFLTGRNPERLAQAARDVGARGSAAFDANDAAAVKRFFADLPGPIDRLLVAAYTSRFYGPMLEHASEDVGRAVSERVAQVLEIARNAAPGCAPGGRCC
jgi:NADP-dependent 3-hydroxy acid dehydrogenase YdfG